MSNDVLTADPNWIVRLLAPDSGPGESPASYMGIRIYPEPEVIIYIKAGDEGSWVFRIYEASFLESSVHLHSLEQGIRRFLPSANTILAVHLGDCAPDFVKYLELFNLWRHPGYVDLYPAFVRRAHTVRLPLASSSGWTRRRGRNSLNLFPTTSVSASRKA